MALEILALRQQVAVLKRKRPGPKLNPLELNPLDQAVLDGPAHEVVSLAGCLSDRNTGNGGGLASGRLSPVLALEIAAAWWPAEDLAGSSRVDSPLGPGECRLGRAEDPRRIAEARLCAVRANRRTVSIATACSRRRSQAMAGISLQPPRGHRHLRFLHCSERDLPRVVLFLRHRARTPSDPAFQRHAASLGRLGRATTPRGPFRRLLHIATPSWITIPFSMATSLPSWRRPE
jgi:hypothetical protein